MKDFINKTEKELKSMLGEKRVALRNFRFSIAGSNIKNVKEGYVLRKDIARILTLLTRGVTTK
ncbi:MAG: 50S ribosomal protein L29 [Candidatus Zambryskibacteria bacterium]|nr:50S ribosomal protein L29 [Candidatus Zambryskibacteria bacterium]